MLTLVQLVLTHFWNAGQGFCLALEDGVVLAWHLREQGLSQQALRM